MAEQFANNYAIIDLETGLCMEVCSDSRNCDGEPGYIRIPDDNPDYILKYYNQSNGLWYEDAEFTIEWIPA